MVPNRIMKDRALTSRALDRLSDGGERLFWRLQMVADDFGRYEAEVELVLARAFPRRVGKMRLSRVEKLHTELVDQAIVVLYKVEGRVYGQVVEWDNMQSRRAQHSKFPEPPEQLLADARKCAQVLADALEESRNRGIEESRNRGIEDPGFSAFWLAYPRKVGKGAARRSWANLDPEAALEDILTALVWQVRQDQWLKEGGQFIPHPSTYLHQERWKDEPPKAVVRRAEPKGFEAVRNVMAKGGFNGDSEGGGSEHSPPAQRLPAVRDQ